MAFWGDMGQVVCLWANAKCCVALVWVGCVYCYGIYMVVVAWLEFWELGVLISSFVPCGLSVMMV